MLEDSKSRIPLQISNKIITVPIRYELTLPITDLLKKDLLSFIDEHKGAVAVIFDLNGVKILGEEEFNDLKKLIQMVSIMGLEVVLCGLAPGIVSTIVDMAVSIKGLKTALDLNGAFKLLKNKE
jgi:rsbT antagonist protein RsbS